MTETWYLEMDAATLDRLNTSTNAQEVVKHLLILAEKFEEMVLKFLKMQRYVMMETKLIMTGAITTEKQRKIGLVLEVIKLNYFIGNITAKDTWIENPSLFATSVVTTTQGSSGVTVFLTIFSIIISNSSPFAIWAMSKQLQLLLLVVIIEWYIPTAVLQYLTGIKLALFNLNFIPYDKFKVVSDIMGYLNYEESNYRFLRIGYNSQLSLRNNLGILLSILSFIILNIWFLITFPPCKVYEESSRI